MSDMYLASQSPRRRELLRQIGVRFTPLSVSVEERPEPGESPSDYVQRLALEKARAGYERLQRDGLAKLPVLGADTIGVFEGQILEKPLDPEHAATILRRLSGRQHQVLSAVAMRDGVSEQVRLSVSEVSFRPLTDTEIRSYWHSGEPADKAGGYAIQGLGAVFVRELRGSYTGVVGLPLEVTLDLLRDFQVPWWQTGAGSE
ncbi:nucleoside triphosphate pyrophosphatase [Marinimicrobium sp. ABcell2]|uniref:Maf family protein n=1 Tax=Marinimicrobium sp. ABcell2 TaxID=3069751 RepID=UPI0027B87241|nr:Maf family protein [Marinimicrobium sp. ABcell2]MDQ2075120.1 Maf family protein [Marinimicrobium sp. ABcell2]